MATPHPIVGSFLNPIPPARVAKVCAWCAEVIESGLAPPSHGICSRCRRGSLARRIAPHLRSAGQALAVIAAFVGLALGMAACQQPAPELETFVLDLCWSCDADFGSCVAIECDAEQAEPVSTDGVAL